MRYATLKIHTLISLSLTIVLNTAWAQSLPPRMDKHAMAEKMARNAFAQILAEADKDGDGNLSMEECHAMWSSKSIAEEHCQFWNANGDEMITQEEYVTQAASLMK